MYSCQNSHPWDNTDWLDWWMLRAEYSIDWCCSELYPPKRTLTTDSHNLVVTLISLCYFYGILVLWNLLPNKWKGRYNLGSSLPFIMALCAKIHHSYSWTHGRTSWRLFLLLWEKAIHHLGWHFVPLLQHFQLLIELWRMIDFSVRWRESVWEGSMTGP